MPRDPRAYLFDTIQAGNRVQKFVGERSFAQYASDDLIRAGVVRQFAIIGEALNQLHKLDHAWFLKSESIAESPGFATS